LCFKRLNRIEQPIFERKIFRRIYGPKYEKGERKSRTNRELEETDKGEKRVKWIKGQRISCLGHLERMEEDRMPKKIFTQELERMRRRGRPRKRWKEEVERDLQVLGVRRWRELVADRKKWKDIFRQWAVVPMEEEGEEEKEEGGGGEEEEFNRARQKVPHFPVHWAMQMCNFT